MTHIATTIDLQDYFSRRIDYLRISVTDRCNIRCVYCMPEAGMAWIERKDLLNFDEIVRLTEAALAIGIRKIRLTGGEPLLRPGIVSLIQRLSALPDLEELSLSTNGILLEEFASDLARAGLQRVNLSLDTLQPERFVAIARRPGLERVLAGIDAALVAGLTPLKINCVVMRGSNDDEIEAFADLTRERPLYVRFIEIMPVTENLELQATSYIGCDELLTRLQQRAGGELREVTGPVGNGPARYFAYPGARGAIGMISPLSHDYCEQCNRVRVTADGRLRLCLFGDHHIDVRTPLRAGATQAELSAILRSSLTIKPERHHLRQGEPASAMRAFSEIGG